MYAAVVGEFSSERSDRLGAALQRAGAEPAFYWDADDAKAALTDPSRPEPRCILLDSESVDAAEIVTWLRQQSRLFPVPAVVLVPEIDEQVLCNFHNAGADDSVPIYDDKGISRRIQKLAEFDPGERPRPDRGVAVVAHQDLARRTVLGRILRIAGFDVAFAQDPTDLNKLAKGQENAPASLLVVHHALLTQRGRSFADVLGEARGEHKTPAIVLSPDSEEDEDGARELREAFASYEGVLVETENAPPDNLAFLANELLLENIKNKRGSARLLHATVCSFRAQGSLNPGYGVTYNLSAGGLYVRTLDTPVMGTKLWIELTPPEDGETDAVHLRGEVMWGQKMSNRRASPPGFGLRFDTASCPSGDLGKYLECYHEVLG